MLEEGSVHDGIQEGLNQCKDDTWHTLRVTQLRLSTLHMYKYLPMLD